MSLRHEWAGSVVELRPLHPRRDRAEWEALRRESRSWTAPWDSTDPHPTRALGYRQAVKYQDAEARAGRLLPWVLVVDGHLAGQVHVFSIVRGAQQGGTIGYWITQRLAGRGITPLAVAMAMDHAFGVERLHRIEINIRPENLNSLRVVEKLGLRDEGVRRAFLHIAGQWRDHRTFALTADEVGAGGLVARVADTRKVEKTRCDTRGVSDSL